MVEITEATSIEELAVIISEALEAAGITATLSGGGAVSIYSKNRYMSHDLDFVTSADHKSLLRQHKKEWRRLYGIQDIALFGSLARDEATASSDSGSLRDP